MTQQFNYRFRIVSPHTINIDSGSSLLGFSFTIPPMPLARPCLFLSSAARHVRLAPLISLSPVGPFLILPASSDARHVARPGDWQRSIEYQILPWVLFSSSVMRGYARLHSRSRQPQKLHTISIAIGFIEAKRVPEGARPRLYGAGPGERHGGGEEERRLSLSASCADASHPDGSASRRTSALSGRHANLRQVALTGNLWLRVAGRPSDRCHEAEIAGEVKPREAVMN